MKTTSAAIVLAAALASTPLAAAPDPALEPIAFLAGHCWKGSIPGTSDTDEHCFAWLYEGRYLRDRHVVRRGDKAIYEGESTYFWNGAEKRIEYFYVTAAGGHAHGRIIPEDGALVSPAATLVGASRSMNFRARWKRLGEDSYEVLREYETDKGWVAVTMEMKKVVK